MADNDDDTNDTTGLWPLRIACFAFGLFFLGPLGAHLDVVPPLGGFIAFALGGIIGLFNSIAGIIIFRRGARQRALVILALSEIPALALVFGSLGGVGKPAINDITTDLAEPPNLIYAMSRPANHGRDLVYPEEFKDQVSAAYPDLKPLHFDEKPDPVFARALELARSRPDWEIDSVNESAHVFEGVATSRLFKFQDDFVVRVRPEESGSGSVVDMRSKSRDGKGDLGANAERMKRFLDDLARAR